MKRLNQVLLHQDNLVGADLDAWLEHTGGGGLQEALQDPSVLVDTIKAAGLRGLGGSGFPTCKKWEFVAAQPSGGDKYLICNGNEDEPGTFKDRILLEQTPHQVIEGATITALALDINRVVFYINPEQERSLENMREAVAQWEGSSLYAAVCKRLDRPLEYRVVPSSGHYIGGEETAAIETVEGKFPFPRGKPPFPAQSGVHGCPTLINNIETLANVSHIVKNGAEWYRNQGMGEACGT
ncbi:MAG: NADH-quinone oxidoreductase subunit F, partial [Gammaproteobacteria bacterium]|nr:NADH-quinone oxidoreductase subunit F [Gammaproteobacteria bacterium]